MERWMPKLFWIGVVGIMIFLSMVNKSYGACSDGKTFSLELKIIEQWAARN